MNPFVRPVTSPTFHVVGLGLMLLSPGLLFSAAIEWGSSTSHDEWALLSAAVICFLVGWIDDQERNRVAAVR